MSDPHHYALTWVDFRSFPHDMDRGEPERLSREELIDLVLRLRRPPIHGAPHPSHPRRIARSGGITPSPAPRSRFTTATSACSVTPIRPSSTVPDPAPAAAAATEFSLQFGLDDEWELSHHFEERLRC